MYGTREGFTSYHTARGNDIGDYSNGAIDIALLVASEYLDGAYRTHFPGFKVDGRDQIREWPRYDAFDIENDPIPSDTVPTEMEYATYEAALRHLATPGSLLGDFTPSKYRRVSIGGSIDVTYAMVSAQDVQKQFPAIDRILQPITGNSGVSQLSGAVSRG